MNKKKRLLQKMTIIGVIIIGMYMLISFDWGTPPALSGLGFLLTGLSLWVPYCPIVNMLLGDKS